MGFEPMFRPRVLLVGMKGPDKKIPTKAWQGYYAPNGIRTHVSALRGPRPGPLDNGGL